MRSSVRYPRFTSHLGTTAHEVYGVHGGELKPAGHDVVTVADVHDLLALDLAESFLRMRDQTPTTTTVIYIFNLTKKKKKKKTHSSTLACHERGCVSFYQHTYFAAKEFLLRDGREHVHWSIRALTLTVSASAMIWHGWLKSVRPLTTGTEPYLARSNTSSWANVRAVRRDLAGRLCHLHFISRGTSVLRRLEHPLLLVFCVFALPLNIFCPFSFFDPYGAARGSRERRGYTHMTTPTLPLCPLFPYP